MKGYMWYIHVLVRVNTEERLRANLEAAFFILSQSSDDNNYNNSSRSSRRTSSVQEDKNNNDNDNDNGTQQQKTRPSTNEALADYLVLHAFAHHGLAYLLVTAPLDTYTTGYAGIWAVVGVPERLRGEFCRRLYRLLFDLHIVEWPHGVVEPPPLVFGNRQQQQQQQKELGQEHGQGIAEHGCGSGFCVPSPTVGIKTGTELEAERTTTTTTTTPLIIPVSPFLSDTEFEPGAENASVDVFTPLSRSSWYMPCLPPSEDGATVNTWSEWESNAQKQEEEYELDGYSEEDEEMAQWGHQREQQSLTRHIPARSSRRAVVTTTETTPPHLRSETRGTFQELYPSPEESPTGAYWRHGRDADAVRLSGTRQREPDVWRVSWQFCPPPSLT